jgi:hypothetical protein
MKKDLIDLLVIMALRIARVSHSRPDVDLSGTLVEEKDVLDED